jgi:hypothetical protein
VPRVSRRYPCSASLRISAPRTQKPKVKRRAGKLETIAKDRTQIVEMESRKWEDTEDATRESRKQKLTGKI